MKHLRCDPVPALLASDDPALLYMSGASLGELADVRRAVARAAARWPVEVPGRESGNPAGSELLELTLSKTSGEKVASIVFDAIVDRRARNILSLRDQEDLRHPPAKESA